MRNRIRSITARCRGRDGQRGLALVVVLWVLVLLSLIAASFSRTTRTEINVARNLVDNAKAEALAEAGVYLAILALLDPDPAQRPRADGTPFEVAFGGAEITVSVQDEGGKIDLNQAPDELLRGLLLAAAWTGPDGEAARLGADEADALVDAIRDFADEDDLHRLSTAPRTVTTRTQAFPGVPRTRPSRRSRNCSR